MLKNLYEVAFDKNVDIIKEESFNKTIDMKIGVYNSMLSISLKPSNSNKDWKTNFHFTDIKHILKEAFAFIRKPSYANLKSKVKVHVGYIEEWEKYRDTVFNIIRSDTKLLTAISNGLIVVGRSKGGGSSSIVALDIVRNFNIHKDKCYILQAEAPKIGNKAYVESVHKYINKDHIFFVSIGNDVVTMVVPWYHNPGIYIKFDKKILPPVSVLAHSRGCFDTEKMIELSSDYDIMNQLETL